MSKKSAILKWLSRLKGYGYINPDENDKGGARPKPVPDDGGLDKSLETNAAESSPPDQDREPQARNVVPDTE